MKILAKRSDKSFLLWMHTILILQNMLASPGSGFKLPAPLNPMQLYSERPKRSPGTICVEIKPNGPLEEPYYMCKGTDFPTFPKLTAVGNTPAANYGGKSAFSDTTIQQTATNSAQKSSNGAAFNSRIGADSGANFKGLSNQFQPAGSVNQFETQTFVHEQNQQTSNADLAYNKQHSKFNPFIEQTSKGAIPQESNNQFQNHMTSNFHQNFQPMAHQQQQHHNYQQQAPKQHFLQSQQLLPQSATGSQPFHRTDQFFRPTTKTESSASIETLNSYDSNYSDGASKTAVQQQNGFIPSAPYTTQHIAAFGGHSSTPVHHSTTKAAESGQPSFASHNNQQFETSQYALHGAPDCGQDCGKFINQATASSGASQYAAKSTIHNSGYASQGTQSSGDNGSSSQYGYSHQPAVAAAPNGDDKNSSPFPSTNYSPSNNARSSATSSFRHGSNGAAAFTATDGPSVPSMGPSNTPQLGTTVLRPVGNGAHFPNEGTYSDAFSGPKPSQATNRPQFEAEKKGQHPHPFHQQNQHVATQNEPASQRYRSGIDDEVLQMPNWGFSSDELGLYRSASSEEKDTINELTGMALPVAAPLRLIPLEHLEDPVMRTFYSSLDGVGPLPSISSSYPMVSYDKSPLRPNLYQSPMQSCSYPPMSPYYNYSPCPPQREYSVQPIFIALPCYGQSMTQALGSPAPEVTTANQLAQSVGFTQTHTDHKSTQVKPIVPQSEVRTIGKSFDTDNSNQENENSAINASKQDVPKDKGSKMLSSSTIASTTKKDSNESGESLEDPVPTSSPNFKSSSKYKGDVGSVESEASSSEKPTKVKFETSFEETSTTLSPNVAVEKAGSLISTTTPSSADARNGQMSSEMSTTFKSLILTARKLAQMVTTSQEEDEMRYKDSPSTPKPAFKRARLTSRSLPNANGSGRNKQQYM